MNDGSAGAKAATPTLKAGALHWLQVSALGIAISGNVAGWNYGLGVGGFGGMFVAALAMAVLFWCLTQSLAELSAALPAAFIRLRRREPELARSYRALGGTPVAAVAFVLSLSVMVSCCGLEVRALQIAIAAIALLVAQFLWLKPARFEEHEA